MNPGLRFCVYTFGCKLNFSESSTLARSLENAGYAKVDLSDYPDILIINTCSVTENADKKCRALIRRSRSENPNLFVAVVGCYAQLKPQEIKAIEGVDLVLRTSEKFNLAEHLLRINEGKEIPVLGGGIKEAKVFHPSYSLGDRTRTFLKVQDGCDYFCSFCTIPLARGLSRSTDVASIVDQAREIADSGIKEIVLTGVNIGDFGSGTDENFYDLIIALDEIQGVDRFRISSIEPNLLTDEIIEFVARSDKFVPHFHIPLQSGSDKILKLMRRKYNTRLYRSRIDKIRECMPNACIGIDVITGFPGETESEFQATVEFLRKIQPGYLHVFTYSERNNTRAIRMEGTVPVETRRSRSKLLQNMSERFRNEYYLKHIGDVQPVLFEQFNDGTISGFTENYLRVRIDGGHSFENSVQQVLLSSMEEGEIKGQLITTEEPAAF